MKKLKILKYIIIIFITLITYITLTNQNERLYTINILKEPDKLILASDFRGNLNRKYWNIIEQGKNTNNELQYYTNNNVIIKNNNLSLIADNEQYNNHNYTSGMLSTKGKFEFLYGKVIIKAKSAPGKGLLSAIWLLPVDDSFLPEIDIIEILGEKTNEVWMGTHYENNGKRYKSFNTYSKLKDNFNLYELVWNKDEIRWSVNGNIVHKTNKGVPNKEMYLIINLAVGGDWPQDPDNSIFPAEFLIDYIVIIPEDI
ncbi:MAG: glycoside hydrolase family 16 protein [Bacilli bacterium]|nr:glycoside hydrolase family 16 protein [Bacilli bacterium]